MAEHDSYSGPRLSRRRVLQAAAMGGIATGLGAFLAACGIKTSSPSASADAGASTAASVAPSSVASVAPSAAEAIPFKIGFVSPQTGAVAGFGEPDPYIIGLVQDKLKAGFSAGGKNYAITIVQKDGQSDPAKAAQAANDLITSDKVDMILATSTPENNNPVADAAEAAGVPFIGTVEPWEAFFFARQKDPAKPVPFKFTYLFCFGVAEFAKTYISMWDDIPTNKKVGVMWPNDADGNAIRAALGPELAKAGYTIVDPGAYEDGTNDYSAQIAKFKAEDCQIFNTFPIPPDFAAFWKQAAQQGYVPKIAQIAKTGLFPSQIEALGDLGPGLASAAYWTPTFPYSSTLLGTSSADLGSGYTAATGRQWNQDLGTTTALFDAATSAIAGATDPKDKVALAAAIGKLNITSTIGKIDFTSGPFPNVSPSPIIGGQWIVDPTGKFKVDFSIVENATDPNVPIAGKLTPYRA
jgi:branched-chain amino acid transport system substrate-binding protein